MFQEKVLGQGPQNNESAFEQRKDEAISDCSSPARYLPSPFPLSCAVLIGNLNLVIRGKFKSATGKEFPVADK